MRAIGECDPPVAHGAGGIELCGARKRADRFRVIESVDESQALVEVLLCGRDSSGDAFVVGAEVRVEGDRVRKALRRRGRHRRLCARAGSGIGEQGSRGEPDDVGELHDLPPSSLGREMQLVGRMMSADLQKFMTRASVAKLTNSLERVSVSALFNSKTACDLSVSRCED